MKPLTSPQCTPACTHSLQRLQEPTVTRSEAASALDAQSVTVLKLTRQRDELLDKLGYAASCLKTDGTDPIDVAIARIKADL